MKIQNFIRYRNPLGHFVEDFVTDHEISLLIKRGIVKPFNYRLIGTFHFDYVLPQHVELDFIYYVDTFAYETNFQTI